MSNQDERRALLEERLRLFDPDRHGGEFPTERDIALQLPDDMPVRERPSLDGDLQVQPIGLFSAPEGRHARSAQLWPLIRQSALLFFVPLTGAIRGIRREYKRLNRAERSRQRDQAEFARRGLTVIDRSKAVGDGIPADFVLAKLRTLLLSGQARQGSCAKGAIEMRAGASLTRDYTVTVSERMQNDPLFAEAMLDEAIALAANGLSEQAKQILLDLFNAGQALPASKADE